MSGSIPKSPRQRMINLMYIVLTAMLALNVSSDVLNGFTLVEESLKRTIKNALDQNKALYGELCDYYQKNEKKVQEWYDKGTEVHTMSTSLFNYIQDLKVRIVEEADGKKGDVNNIKHVDDLEASNRVMLATGKEHEGTKLRLGIEAYRNLMASMITNPDKRQIIIDNFSTEPSAKAKADNKNWEQSWFENMPVAAAITLLSKLQSDVLYAEGEVLHTLVKKIDESDFRVNDIKAHIIPNTKYVIRGGKYSAQIVLAAVDTTQRPDIYINNSLLPAERKGLYEVVTSATGQQPISGYMVIPGRNNEEPKRYYFNDFYIVMEPTATVSATMMNVLYAGYDNPISISVPGVPTNLISASSSGNGSFTAKGNGLWNARPTTVGQDFMISVTAQIEGRSQNVANTAFKVRQLPDPLAFIEYKDENGNNKRFRQGNLSKQALMGADGVKAAIDDGLLNISFQVLRFDVVFHDARGDAIREPSDGGNFSEKQKEQFRRLTRGKVCFISKIVARGPDGIERTLPPIEITIN